MIIRSKYVVILTNTRRNIYDINDDENKQTEAKHIDLIFVST